MILFLLSAVVFARDYPRYTDEFYVNDFAGVLDQQTKEYIIRNAQILHSATGAQVVVVTIDGLESEGLEEYTLGLFREWEIGDAQANNGILIFLDLEGRQSRIDVGYGLEGVLPDGKTGRIQEHYMMPHFQENNFSIGVQEGFRAIVNEIYIEYGLEGQIIGDYTPIDDLRTSQNEIPPIFIWIGTIFIIILIILDFRLTGGMFTFMIIRSLGRGGSLGGGSGRTRGGGGSAGGGGSSRGW
jgi:uncharacterized protein